jgi:peptidoglycan/LPS O-acetylase OafA/YrhL
MLFFFTKQNIEYKTGVLPLIVFIVLSLTVLSFAFSYKNLSNILLANNDISYGLYIYHMLIINLIIEHSLFSNNLFKVAATLSLTLIVSFFSWKFIGKKSLLLNRH